MDRLQTVRDIAADPAAYARKWQTQNRREVIGTFCSYAPEEVILAAGALGYRIFGSGAEISKADAHMQAYSCSLVRGALEETLSGGLEFLDGVVFPHTCDSIQRLSDIWRMNVKQGFHLDLVMPVKLNTDSSRDYMVDIFKRFKRELEQAIGREISEEDLDRAIDTCNQIREQMQRLYTIRQLHPDRIKGSDMHALVKAGMVMDRNEFLDLVQQLVADLESPVDENKPQGKRIVLAGGLCNMPDVYGVIEHAGAMVVADDLCTGARFYEGMIAAGGNQLETIAHRYSDRNVCPAKHSGNRSRGENLVRLVKESQAEGVLYLYLKFCDPHGFDYPYLREMLEENGIPCLLYEMEDQLLGGGQFETRLEAFLEML